MGKAAERLQVSGGPRRVEADGGEQREGAEGADVAGDACRTMVRKPTHMMNRAHSACPTVHQDGSLWGPSLTAVLHHHVMTGPIGLSLYIVMHNNHVGVCARVESRKSCSSATN